jgi:hypothetical protein
MKKYILSIMVAALACGTTHAAPPVYSVAVFDFESKDENVHDLGTKIATLISADLSAESQIVTVEREELAKVVGEQELGLSGNVSSETAAKVGQLTGAKVLVTGRVFKTDDDLILVAKIIGVETSRVYGEIVKGHGSATVADLSDQLAKKIAKTVTEKGETLVTQVESRDDKIKKILDSVKGDKRPSVSVNIAERHFGQAVIDPSAQTELGYLLKKAGFTVVDDKSDAKPDIEITGEAFSAFGMRKGNLISCRSRLELKAQERKSGKILAIDRQTSVAVDIAEQIAAKNALQNAADELAARLLPKLSE